MKTNGIGPRLATLLVALGGPSYEFDGPALNELTAGQRILIRMGALKARRVQARLAEFRRLIGGPAAALPR